TGTRTHKLSAVATTSAAVLAMAAGLAGTTSAATPSDSAAGTATTGNSGSTAVPQTLDGIKTRAQTDITDRVDALDAAVAKAGAAKGLGAAQAALVAYLGADVTPLQQLDQKIQSDTTVRQAVKDFSTIFSGYRVYLLVLPAAHVAGDADAATATGIPALTAAAAKAQARVNPSNQAELQPLINDLNGQISAATSATNGLAATVLGFTPAQWDANHDLLSATKSSQQTADAALAKGRDDVRQIREDRKTPGAGAAATPTG
ncbi:MAG TPA: hypothetical protein VEH82_09865, partial [Acidimicrobiales bacterium]|nr:hypothetical protein [Acidimicrobiales bacterium]